MSNEAITSKKTLSSILKVSGSNILKLCAGVLVGFLLPKIIGVTDYGYYKTFTLYASYVGLLHFGFADGIYLKYGGENYEKLNKQVFRFYTSFLMGLEFIISFIGAIIALFVLAGELRFIFICLAVYLFTANIINHYQIISQITGRFNELSIRTVIQSIFTALAVIALWVIHHFSNTIGSYKIYTIIYVGINVLLTIWYIYTYKDITFGKQDRSHKREIWQFIKLGFPLLLANLCSTLILNLDRQFVNILFDTDTYAVYAFAYNMLGLIMTAMSAISTVIYPTLKRTDEKTLKNSYTFLIETILIFVFVCLLVYFPLCWFINWFLPNYIDSLLIFRIILPGLAISSAITIVMHNYYKTMGKENVFFIKSIIILFLSAIANYVAYAIFKTTQAISASSIFVMVIWYIFIEIYFIKNYKIKWLKNFTYMLLMASGFYLITCWNIWWTSMLIYLTFLLVVTYGFYYKDINRIIKKLFKKEN